MGVTAERGKEGQGSIVTPATPPPPLAKQTLFPALELNHSIRDILIGTAQGLSDGNADKFLNYQCALQVQQDALILKLSWQPQEPNIPASNTLSWLHRKALALKLGITDAKLWQL